MQPWPRTEEEALAVQDELRGRVIIEPGPARPATVAGLDVAYAGDRLAAAGMAHPRRFGLASHLGVLTGLPSFGVGKTKLIGNWAPVGESRGSRSPLIDGDETVGAVLRTQTGVKPVFVSVGHKMDIDTACALTLTLSPRYRLPETTRVADRACRDLIT
jgi:deoxyinosine 3'endonuclease (endonuclease V)